jgi:chromosome segregation ATPase
MYNRFNRTTSGNNTDDDEMEYHPMPGSIGERQQQAEQEARAREEAARNQPAPQPESEQEAIITRHLNAARKEIGERAKLTAAQREVESLETQIEELSAKMEPMFKEPSRYKKQLEELEPKLAALFKRHEELTAQPRKPNLPNYLYLHR